MSPKLRDLKSELDDAERHPDQWNYHLRKIGKRLVEYGEYLEKRLDALEKQGKDRR